MQFKYPEILYALLLLIIPIIVHLFQLRRFEKVAFSNVDFLKKVELQTRKSSKLKKILILLSRLFLLAALIFAFAQPYFSKNKSSLKPQTILYLDNSLSMQAKDGSNELFKKAVQSSISNYVNTKNISVLTNNDFFKNLDNKALKNQLLSLDYHPIPQELNTILLKTNNLLKKKKLTKNHIILVSDFQNTTTTKLKLDSLTHYSFVQLTPQTKKNISIDSVFISNQNAQEITLKARIKSHQATNKNLAVSLFNNNILIGKTTANIINNKTSEVSFNFPFNANFNGEIRIEDNLIDFDNSLFFSLNKLERIDVLAIGSNNEFLKKIYTKKEFNLTSKKINQLDYNKIEEQHLIVLNELNTIPNALQQTLKTFVTNGGSLVVIPSRKINLDNYNSFFNSLKIGNITSKKTADNKVTNINFSHQILANVFEKQIKNFQYPNVKSSYFNNFKNTTSILSFNNQKTFISQTKIDHGKLYYLAAAINTKNSNFKNSPLIVPIFYNFGKQSFNITNLYYTIGKPTVFEIQTQIKKDEILQIKNNDFAFIPLQSVGNNVVKITTQENPLRANHYQVFKGKNSIKNIAFNYDRIESETNYANIETQIKKYKNASFSTNINQAFLKIKDQYKTKSLWKRFVGLAILFLIIEMLLIKYFKSNRL